MTREVTDQGAQLVISVVPHCLMYRLLQIMCTEEADDNCLMYRLLQIMCTEEADDNCLMYRLLQKCVQRKLMIMMRLQSAQDVRNSSQTVSVRW